MRSVATGVRRGLAVVAVIAVLGVGLAAVSRWGADREHDRRCAALLADVEGLDGITWDNGITSSGPAWIGALTDGIENADESSRVALAERVVADVDGYVAVRDALDELGGAGGSADRLKRELRDPERASTRRAEPTVVRDVQSIRRVATSKCGILA